MEEGRAEASRQRMKEEQVDTSSDDAQIRVRTRIGQKTSPWNLSRSQPRQDHVSFDTFQCIWPFVQGMTRPLDGDDTSPISYTEVVDCGIVPLPTGAWQ